MARIIRAARTEHESYHPELVRILREELRENQESGQPRIDEKHLSNNTVHIRVFWDEWNDVTEDQRSQSILVAYREQEPELYERISVATGLTFPEATELGLLPFQIVMMLRKDDPFSVEDVKAAMIAEGASTLANPDHPQLRFGTKQEAECCLHRLKKRLPESDAIWSISEDVGYLVE